MMDVAKKNVAGGKKRKQKRSSNQMAKKFARSRSHGVELDSSTYQYMVRVMELLKLGFPSDEEKQIFVNNVFGQTIGREVDFAKNQLGSRLLESLLKYASLEAIQRLVAALNDSLRPLSNDRFASHVLQKIISVCADRGNRLSNVQNDCKVKDVKKDLVIEVKESEVKIYNDLMIKFGKYWINNMEEFVSDTYASHVLRTVFECLGGLIDNPTDDDRTKIPVASKERRPVVQNYKDLLVSSCKKVLNWPQMLEFGQNEHTSRFLQSILHSLKDIDQELTKSYVTKITTECFKPGEDNNLSNVFASEPSVRLLEACMATCPQEVYHDIYINYFKGHIRQLSMQQSTNFSVQSLLNHCPTKEDFEFIFDEIENCLSEVLLLQYLAILSNLANACTRLQTKQGAFVKAIMKLLECDATPTDQLEIVKCTAALKPLQVVKKSCKEKENFVVNFHGSLIVQAMLQFNKPIKIVNSLLNMHITDLLHLFSDPKGSRIADAFMESKYIGEKSRENLAKKLQGCCVRLAQSVHGSRSLEKIWQWAHGNFKNSIMDELVAAGESLRTTKTGRIISIKFYVALYARSKKDWLEVQGKEDKIKAMFADIVADTKDKTADTKDKTADTEDKTADTEDKTADTEDKTADTEDETTDTEDKTADTEDKTADTEDETTDTEDKTTDAEEDE